MLPVSWFVQLNSKSHSHNSLSHKHIFILPQHSHHERERNSFNQTSQGLQQFWMSFRSHSHQLNSCRDISDLRADPVLSRLRPSSELGVGHGSASAQPSHPHFKCPRRNQRETVTEMGKKIWMDSILQCCQSRFNLGWNSFSSMTDPVHAANTHKSTHFCELCWKETCISWNPIGKPVLWIAYYFTNKTLRLMTY